MARNRVLQRVLLFAGFYVLALFVYRNGLSVPYFYDDFQRVFTDPRNMFFRGFTAANPFDHFYRPIEQLFLAAVQLFWKLNTMPIHLVHLFFHAGCALLVYHILRFWEISIISAICASVFVIISQISSYAILSNNTLSQLMGTLSSGLSLWLLYRYVSSKEMDAPRWKYYLSIFFFFLAILSKETFAGLPIGILLIIGAMQEKDMAFAKRLKDGAKLFLPFGLCIILYSIARINADAFVPSLGNSASPTYYSFGFGANILRNIGIFVLQIIVPVSSFAAKKAIHYRDYSRIIPIAILTLAYTFIIGISLWRASHRGKALILIILMCATWFPVILLNHDIGDCYGYGMILYLGGLIGISIEYYLTRGMNKILLTAVCSVFVLSGFTNLLATNEKAISMMNMGNRAEKLLPQLITFAKSMPPNGRMYLIDPADSEMLYPRYSLGWFYTLDFADGDSTLHFYSGRNDITSRFSKNLSAYHDSALIHPGMAFTCDTETLRVFPISDTAAFNRK